MPMRLVLEKLRKDVETMGEMCEFAVASAVMALVDHDADLAFYILDYDREIDEMELAVDQDCIGLMREGRLSEEDLRFVASASRINSDLERVGDLAVDICEHVLFLVREKSVLPDLIDFNDMLDQVNGMMRESVESMLNGDTTLAWKIIDERVIVDEEGQVIFSEILDVMKRDSRAIERCCHVLSIMKSLHRVADQASNIAEEVIYRTDGVVVRHNIRELHPVMPKPFGDAPGAEAEKLAALATPDAKSRDAARAAVKGKTRRLTAEQVAANASAGADKARKARELLLRQRAAARKK